ncbi:LOW QUALITY PROTEIN: hypothetical protein Cgig2_029571 [Carnegiea gigantea]|uniref:NADH-ubiquinone oxidoreductase chain 4 n=1 Tax=Carnegiea gigantea TaxID=171969 RepID=A0A9Q1GR77_9CARY|nr:LOW QUALITY PROTEIN: hypothetical protein Cgig2_029571 [Carnegiea gigantea]
MLEHFYERYSDLSGLILCPVLGNITLLFIPNSRIRLIRLIGLFASLITFLYSSVLWIQFDPSTAKSQFVESLRWLPYENISFYLGIDDISLFFMILTTFLIPICILLGWSASLIREFLMIVVFCMLDLLLFYVLFEGVPILIQRKIKAAYQFFLYTLLGSVFMLLAILLILLQTDTTDLQILLTTEFSERRHIFLWIAFFASFAFLWYQFILVTRSSCRGTHGRIRYLSRNSFKIRNLPIDRKKIIAYSSVAHKNFVTIGMFSLNIQGIRGSILPMLSQRLVSSALFLCVGVLYDRYKTRLVRYYEGLVSAMPNFSLIFFFFTLANMSLPGTSSFIGEFLILVAAFQRNSLVAILAALGMINKRFIWGNEIDQPLGVVFEPAGRKWDGALGCGLRSNTLSKR